MEGNLFSLISRDRMSGNGTNLFQGRFRFVIRMHFFSEKVVVH